ncbi:MAG: quinolinate synthase, partial [Candidatus Magasanikbacteria bacterium CG10_big_fil_rev_8_21_14_0_10_43_6]
GENIQKQTNKQLILWDGTCVVHEQFTRETAEKIRASHPDVKILAHLECSSSLVEVADMVGSTSDMLRYVKEYNPPHVMLITECGITDRVKTEFPDKHIVGACQLCPFMKQITLDGILTALRNPQPEQIITIPKNILDKAHASLQKMMTL